MMFAAAVERRRLYLALTAILTVAFVLRLGARMAYGEDHFWTDGYLAFYRAAQNLADGNGFCNGTACSRPPIYVAFLALTLFLPKNYLFIVVPQALIGTGTTLCAFLIGRQIFSPIAGLIACALASVYPYYVMHDTALQDTAMYTFACALAVWLLLRASLHNRPADWLCAGAALGAVVLVRASLAPVVAAAVLWTTLWGRDTIRERLRATVLVALAAVVVMSPWLITTYRHTGAPVLSTDAGYMLWVANNPDTFSRYPVGSIDRSRDVAVSHLTTEDRAELEALSGDQRASGAWYARRALDFMRAQPGWVAQAAWRKIEAGFSWRLSPQREPLAQLAYALGYVPVALLGLAGMALAWRKRETGLIVLMVLAFLAVSAVFLSHTSHRVFLDVYLMVFSASVLARLMSPSANAS